MKRLIRGAQLVAIVSATVAAVLYWISAYANPYAPDAAPPEGYGTVHLLIAVHLAGAVVALFRLPYLMYAVFAYVGYPYGFYMLGTPSIFRWIGVADLLFLIAAVVMHVAAYCERKLVRAA